MEIVVLDGYTSNPGDLSWESLEELGKVTVWPTTNDEELLDRAKNADVLVVNKRILGKGEIEHLPKLKCICTLATGYNNVAIETAKARGIKVCNAVGYSSPSVAQHVMAMILHHYNNIDKYFKDVAEGAWARSSHFTFYAHPLVELKGKKLGIYGYGKIGQVVARIAKAMEMEILVITRGKKKDIYNDVTYISEEAFFEQSDIITLHAPLTQSNRYFINTQKLEKMKASAILINTGRGDLINEKDLKEALENSQITAAYLDVLSKEPPDADHILLKEPRCFITPHNAWGTGASRSRLIGIVADNIKAFQNGNPQNVVV